MLGAWQLKSVHLNGAEVTDVPIDFGNGDVDGIEIVLTPRLTQVSGTVTDGGGSVATDGSVIVFADDPDKWGPQSRFIASARPDQQGRFTVPALPPGRYLAIAVTYLEPGEERHPERLEEWRRRATAFTLGEGEARVVDLRLSAF